MDEPSSKASSSSRSTGGESPPTRGAGRFRTPQRSYGRAEARFRDEARKYAYIAEAARPDRSTKQKYFDDYLSKRDVPEDWIEGLLAHSIHGIRQL